uniref:Uncharacterized protein n=1 Tax=Ditylenchus dipsaci TaxID=166011 RepID=A0A915D852_9BILA
MFHNQHQHYPSWNTHALTKKIGAQISKNWPKPSTSHHSPQPAIQKNKKESSWWEAGIWLLFSLPGGQYYSHAAVGGNTVISLLSDTPPHSSFVDDCFLQQQQEEEELAQLKKTLSLDLN